MGKRLSTKRKESKFVGKYEIITRHKVSKIQRCVIVTLSYLLQIEWRNELQKLNLVSLNVFILFFCETDLHYKTKLISLHFTDNKNFSSIDYLMTRTQEYSLSINLNYYRQSGKLNV